MSFMVKALNNPVELGDCGSIFGTGYAYCKRRWHVRIVASRVWPALAHIPDAEPGTTSRKSAARCGILCSCRATRRMPKKARPPAQRVPGELKPVEWQFPKYLDQFARVASSGPHRVDPPVITHRTSNSVEATKRYDVDQPAHRTRIQNTGHRWR